MKNIEKYLSELIRQKFELIRNFKSGFITGLILIGMTIASCEAYLDKTPEATLTDKDVYGTFKSFQGFIEEDYNCITDYTKTLAGNIYISFYFADECLSNVAMMWDDGNYWFDQWRFLTGNVNTNKDVMTKRVWPLSWYAIRKANLAIANTDKLADGTQEERNLIKGQALFFRGFFHFDLSRFYGGLPYIDTVLVVTNNINIPRLNYKQTALKAAKDFEAAAALLPTKWDDTDAGKITLGNNGMRITKIHALAFQGKALLYGASPMMNESSTGVNAYDPELCKQAAAAFAQVIDICNTTGAYKMESTATRTNNFWIDSPKYTVRSGGTEVIMNPTIYQPDFVRWTTCRAGAVAQFNAGNGNKVEVPTQNYIKNYGMANGLPLDDPASGYNPADPWTGRDPRFYTDIVYDGVQMVTSPSGGLDRFAQLYNGGRHKDGVNGSVTGYYYKKWTPMGCNPWDKRWENLATYIPIMRLADVYLMYAESVLHGYGTAQSSVPGSNLTAEEALNIVRERGGIGKITPAYTATKDKFMGEIIRERAVELAFESHRWFDLRRWNIAGDPKYLYKTALDFDRGSNGKPINMKERVVVTRVFDKKNNWVPFQVGDTKMYKEFPQNPGW